MAEKESGLIEGVLGAGEADERKAEEIGSRAEDLSSDETVATFMAAAFETNDSSYIARALGVVARAKGMAQIAGQTGLSREQLYRSFSENGNPTLKTTLAVMKALGLDLTAMVHA